MIDAYRNTVFTHERLKLEILGDLGSSFLLKNNEWLQPGPYTNPKHVVRKIFKFQIVNFLLFKNLPNSVKTKPIYQSKFNHAKSLLLRKIRLLLIIESSYFIDFYNLFSLKRTSAARIGNTSLSLPPTLLTSNISIWTALRNPISPTSGNISISTIQTPLISKCMANSSKTRSLALSNTIVHLLLKQTLIFSSWPFVIWYCSLSRLSL